MVDSRGANRTQNARPQSYILHVPIETLAGYLCIKDTYPGAKEKERDIFLGYVTDSLCT